MIGLAVFDVAGLRLGVVIDVVEGHAQDRLRVATQQAEFDVPFVADLVTEVDLAGRKLIVDPPEGLTELNSSVEPDSSGSLGSSEEPGSSVDS